MNYSNKEKLEKIRMEKEAAIAANDFEKAARLRDGEKSLSESMGRISNSSSEFHGIVMSKKLSRKNIIALLLVCSIFIYPLYQLFVKKTMWCWWVGDVEVSGSDPLFWIYAAALLAPIAVLIVLAYSTFSNRKTIKTVKR